MTDADLNRLESALGLTLPGSYRQFMRADPRWLLDKQPAWAKPVTEWELADDPDCVIAFNQHVRQAKPGVYFDDGPWPHHYFVIGSEARQNWCFLNLAEGSETVYWFFHETGHVGPAAQTLAAFPDSLVEGWEDVEQSR
jgi:hypothetical protein